jgi:hypothetical protein
MVIEKDRLTNIIINSLNGRNANLWEIIIFIDMSQVHVRELCPVRPERQLRP